MDLSIIIPEYKTPELTKILLDNLKETTSWKYETEVIVILDGDSSTYIKRVTDDKLVVTFFPVYYHAGFAGAVNLGIKETTGKYVAIFNNDMTMSPWWDDILIRTLQESRKSADWGELYPCELGMVAGEIFEAEEHPQYLEPGEMLPVHDVAIWNKGAPWMFRRDIFNVVGTFDEQFWPGMFEETDLFIRMAMLGYTHGTVPNVRCLHRRHSTLATQWSQKEFWDLFYQNQQRFIEKWGTIHANYDKALREHHL